MEKYVALLRGINVSGQKMIKMSDLVKYMEEIGARNIQTYIQSGNIIFDHKESSAELLGEMIGEIIYEKCAFHVPVLVLTNKEIQTIFSRNPFIHAQNKEVEKLYVTLLSGKPSEENIEKLKTFESPSEQIIPGNKVIFLCLENGYGNAKLNNNFIENKLKIEATTRNWKTIAKLATMMTHN